MIESYTLGADPEGFLFDHENEKFVPSCGLIGGDKWNPRRVGNLFAMQEDNVMVEYNIPPSEKGVDMAKDIRFITNHIEDEVLGMKYEIKHVPSVVFSKDQLNDERAHIFGCEPDFDVWEERERCINMENTTTRFAGGHIHFGYSDPDQMQTVALIKLFDLFVGVPSVLLDDDQSRRSAYGQAGAFRFKDYGFEYRSLSNFWVKNHEELITNLIDQGINSYNNGIDISEDKEKIITAINNSDKDKANHLIKKYSICMQ